jgi:hypothetical protein
MCKQEIIGLIFTPITDVKLFFCYECTKKYSAMNPEKKKEIENGKKP